MKPYYIGLVFPAMLIGVAIMTGLFDLIREMTLLQNVIVWGTMMAGFYISFGSILSK
jgi:hypothetical protein